MYIFFLYCYGKQNSSFKKILSLTKAISTCPFWTNNSIICYIIRKTSGTWSLCHACEPASRYASNMYICCYCCYHLGGHFFLSLEYRLTLLLYLFCNIIISRQIHTPTKLRGYNCFMSVDSAWSDMKTNRSFRIRIHIITEWSCHSVN